MAALPRGETDMIEVQTHANTDATISTCSADHPDEGRTTDEATAIKQSRKRTKSGCLTCRKRRIKCTEERPKCHNCVKSKRQCEGYTRRVIFKPPVNIYRIGSTENAQNLPHDVTRHHQLLPAGLPGRNSTVSATGSKTQPQLPHIAPRPVAYTLPNAGAASLRTPPAIDGDVQDGRARRLSQSAPSTLSNDLAISLRSYRDQREPGTGLQSSKHPGFGSDFRDGGASRSFHRDDTGQGNKMMTTQYTEPLMGSHLLRPNQSQVSPPLTQNCSSEYDFTARQTEPLRTPTTPDGILPRGPYRKSLGLVSASHVAPDVPELFSKNTLHYERDTHFSSIDIPTSSVEYQISPTASPDDEDDPYDIKTDDEMSADCTQESNRIPTKAPSMGVNQVEGPVRHEFDPKISYETASPPGAQSLKTLPPRMKSKTRQIFYHFIAITGPSISIFERSHADNPKLVPAVAGDPLQPSLWTYTLPTMALQSPALMHALLALSSLHIAKLQGDSMVVPIQYYHRGLLSVGKAVADVKQRNMVVTLAATMLLGFWEVMAAEHNKWNSHLLGARQLLVEADFVALSSRIRECQFAAAKEISQRKSGNLELGDVDIQFQDQSLTSDIQELLRTETLADILTGQKGRYQRVRSAVDPNAAGLPDTTRHTQTPEAMKDDELRLDLVWWFLKQDLYQSILSQNPLLLSYDHWRDCRPRSVIGKPCLPYGTYDCLILVLGRIAHFVSRDVKRKRKAVEANGCQRRSPPGISLGGSPSGSPQGPPGAQGRVGQGPPKPSSTTSPMFYGMVPPREQGHMPAEFLNFAHTPPDSAGNSNSDEDFSLEVATVEAEDEWRDLKRALQVFEDSLGPGFAPISPDGIQPLSTPFGPAVHHRSGAIADIWASYYMGQIILERGHPDMPPAAIMAAGLSARKTSFPAMEIARITAGLLPENMNQPLDPTLRGALIESSLPLFFAGVQYSDPAQRGWTVRRLQDIARLSGWETSLAIASGCESAWEKAGEAGHTVPYSRTLNPWAKDDRIAGRKPGYGRTEEGQINDWRSVGIDPRARVHWAVGLLGFEEDFAKLDLEQHGLEMPGQEY